MKTFFKWIALLHLITAVITRMMTSPTNPSITNGILFAIFWLQMALLYAPKEKAP